jgi:LuxR family transcriptional regulator, maltose regulon positive regulatory protein
MFANILATKLFIPPARANLVLRLRLIQNLNDAWQHDKKLILVSAPAGYGKTTLITDWLRTAQAKSAWLSLDKADNDPARFLTYFIAALQQVDGRMGESTRAMLQSPQPLPPPILLTALINEISAAAEPFALVLDDYHVIEAMPVHRQLDFLVEHQPPQMRLVIISREDPPLPLARLRARGQMVEIRQDDLRFTLEECADFLQRIMGIHLSLEDVAALERSTEGWITGLQLAALSMQRCDDLPGFIKAFSGSSHFVLEYLIEEVFERQTAEEQDFLLKTSILDRLSGPLCDAITYRSDGHEFLDRLEHSNLFIIPLDQSRTWYRYHHLFAELLRQRLHTTAGIAEGELHRAASRWFQAEGLIAESIQHALAACDWEMAAALLQDYSVRLLRQGELMTLLGWLKALPDAVIAARPTLCGNYGWALTLTGRLMEGDSYLRRAETAAQDNQAVLGPILVARAYNLRVCGDNPQAIACARRALALLPQTDSLSRGLVALTLGLAYWNDGNFQESEQSFKEVDQAAQKSGNPYARLTALTYLGMIQAVYGRLHRAAELCRQVIQLGGQSPPVAPAHIELGALLYEWNDLDSAIEHLEMGIEQSKRTGNPGILSDGYRTLAVVQMGRGDYDAALVALQLADQLVESRQVSVLSGMRNAACHVQLALAQDDLTAARFWADQVTAPMDASLFYPCLGLVTIRILLAQDDKFSATQRLIELYRAASQKGCGSGLIEVCSLQALASTAPGDALHFLESALKMAQSEGFIRTFVDKGQPMKALLERLRPQAGDLKEYLLTLLSAFGETNKPVITQALVEPLSERELEVLRLVANGLSNGEIAQRLIVSVGTVKTHVHSIIDKLAVQSRTQAVARARELALL